MTWFPRLRGKHVPEGDAKSAYYPAGGEWDTGGIMARLRTSRRRAWSVERAVVEAYERSVWMYKGVDTIANKAMDRTFCYRVHGSEQVVDDHPMCRLLNGPKANALESGPALRKRAAAQLLLSERGVFVEAPLSRGGDVVRLELLPPERTKPIPTRDEKMIDRYEVTNLDGSIRSVPVEHVRWIRNPHPLDPYVSSIPITAAGLSVQMDDLARQINVSWMSNDGNTRAIVAVKGDMSPTHERKLSSRFGSGPADAGKISVITADGLSYIDLSARPRDLQYEKLAENAKIETLAALGVPESQLGNASGRTYANAESEGYMFWSITMASVLGLLAVAFYDPDDQDLMPFFDVEDVPELQLPLRTRREEARAEFDAGLRSILSYGKLAGIDVVPTEETTALWLPQGRQPLDQGEGAAGRVRLSQPVEDQTAPAAEGGGDGDTRRVEQVAKPAAKPAPPGGASVGQQAGARVASRAGTGATAASTTGGDDTTSSGGAASSTTASGGRESKTYTIRHLRLKADVPWRHADADQTAEDRAEVLVAAALTALTSRWVERAATRLRSPKARKGTRHWQPDPGLPADTRVGEKTLDTETVVDPETWRREAEAAVAALLAATAVEAAGTAAVALTGYLLVGGDSTDGAAGTGAAGTGAGAAGAASTGAGGGGAAAVAGVSAAAVGAGVAGLIGAVPAAVGVAAAAAATRLAARLAARDKDGADLDDLVGEVRGWSSAGWVRQVAATAVGAAAEIGRQVVGGLLAKAGWEVVSTWRARDDGRVRASHVTADGQTRKPGGRFKVGDASLRFPRDPEGPAGEVLGCRCWARWSARRVTSRRGSS